MHRNYARNQEPKICPTEARAVQYPVFSVYTRFFYRIISAPQSVSWNCEGYVGSVQPIKCMLYILICNRKRISTLINNDNSD